MPAAFQITVDSMALGVPIRHSPPSESTLMPSLAKLGVAVAGLEQVDPH
jgi:hypothetical protein